MNSAEREADFDDDEIAAMMEEAYALLEGGRRAQAADVFELIERARPTHYSFRPGHAEALWLGRDDTAGALATVETCLALNDDSIGCVIWRARIRAATGDVEGSNADFVRSLEYRPVDVDIREQYARSLVEQGALEEALRVMDDALRLESQRFSVRLLRARTLESMGSVDLARLAFEDVRLSHRDAIQGATYLLHFLERHGMTQRARTVRREIEREIDRRTPDRRLRPL